MSERLPPAPAPRVILVRHGRSAHAVGGWLDADGLRRWLDAYDLAGIAADDRPPPALRDAAARAGLLVASDLARAMRSAELLAPGVPVLSSPLLRETPLPIPALRGVRLPVAGWALAIGAGAALRLARGAPPPVESRGQGAAAAAWLRELAERHGVVLAVTHANVRTHIAAAFAAGGWRREPGGKRLAHWSAWTFAPPADGRAPHRERSR